MQKFEDSAPESLEFERLKEHFEPFLRTSSLPSLSHLPTLASHHLHTSSATAAASAALARDIPGNGKYNLLGRSRAGTGSHLFTIFFPLVVDLQLNDRAKG